MKRVLIGLVLAATLLSGCTGKASGSAVKANASTVLDTPTAQLVLYAPDTEGKQLLRTTREMVVPDGQLPLQAALVALLADDDPEHAPIFGGGGKLSTLIKTRDVLICDVLLPVAAEEVSERVLMQSAAALLETVRANSTAEYLYLEINGSPLSPRGTLENPMSTQNLSLERLWIFHQYYMNRGETLNAASDRKLLFYTDASGEKVLGCVTEDTPRDGNQLRDLVQRLSVRPDEELVSVIPQNLTLSEQPGMETDAEGRQTVHFDFAMPEYETLSAREVENLCSALTLSVCLNFAGVDRVEITVDGTLATEIPGTAFTGMEVLNQETFLDGVGDMLTLYFPVKDGACLQSVRRAVSQSQAASLRTGIDELLRGPLASEDDALTRAFPADITSEDLLSVESQGDLLIVQFSQDFQDAYPLDGEKERMMIYAMVNTLTDDERVCRIQIQVASKRVGVLGTLDLTNPLIRNPGIIQH